ncbi:DUF3795 domain-containing protein [Candidatus Neomarinimicrobiota bacterium]
MNNEIYIGCCGTYCKTCKPFKDGFCKGCKLGYHNGERDITRAKCKMKVCCLNKNLTTCADCTGYKECNIIQSFQDKSGYKYKKYKESIYFIRHNGCSEFIKIAEDWNGPYGKLK